MAQRPTSQWTRPFAWLLGLTTLVFVISCASPEQRYRVLSFFFDGVPVPGAQESSVSGGDPDGGRVAMAVFQHAPYAANQCSDCHGEIGEFTMSLSGYVGLTSDICLKCHEGIQTEFRHMHGPVAATTCLTCHEPHSSRYKHLLKINSPAMCIQCHARDDLAVVGTPQHSDLAVDCLTCHHGHGGSDRYFLRDPIVPTPTHPPPEAGARPDAQTPAQPETQTPAPTESGGG